MQITGSTLKSLNTGFSAAFQGAFDGIAPTWNTVAMEVKSTTSSNEYGWLTKMPRIREWIGDRVVNALSKSGYTIRNRSFESTIGVDRDDIADDNIGIYSPVFAEFGRSSATFPDELVWGQLKVAHQTLCFDGQNYFDTDHPVILEDGTEGVYSNDMGGAGEPWYLLDTSRAIKPFVFQNRQPFNFVAKDNPNDESVWIKKQLHYGVDGRCNVGFSFPQLAVRSRQPLTPANYATARAAMIGFKADRGLPLGIVPTTIVSGPVNEGAMRVLVQSKLVNGGEDNPWANSVTPVMSPWLA